MKLSLTQMPELKEAILSLSEKEKDKILTRLINKDQMLIKQLHFKLLENEEDLIDRTKELRLQIIEAVTLLTEQVDKISTDRKYEILNQSCRQLNGMVNEHASITKDKVSEFELRLLILDLFFKQFSNLYQPYSTTKIIAKHLDYLATKIKAILIIYDKLHPDLQHDYKNNLLEVLEEATYTVVLYFLKVRNIDVKPYFD